MGQNISFNDAIRMAIYYGKEKERANVFAFSEEEIAYVKQCKILEKKYLSIIENYK